MHHFRNNQSAGIAAMIVGLVLFFAIPAAHALFPGPAVVASAPSDVWVEGYPDDPNVRIVIEVATATVGAGQFFPPEE